MTGTLHPVPWVLLAVACTLLPAAAAGDDADDIIREIARTTRTRTEAAKALVKAVKSLTDAPAVQARVCEKAYEYGIMAPAGYPSAFAALDTLDRIAPLRADTWRAKRLEVHRLKYLRGPKNDKPENAGAYVVLLLAEAAACEKRGAWPDAAKYKWQTYQVARAMNLPQKKALYEAARAADRRVMTRGRVKMLTAAVTKTPTDASSRKQLVLTYLVDLDRPDQAAKYLTADLDAELRAKVSLAVKGASVLGDEDFLTLGRWYRALAARAPARDVKVLMLTRSGRNLNMYLEVHTKQDMHRLAANETLKAVDAELRRLGGARLIPLQGSPPGDLLTTKLGPSAERPAIMGWGTKATPLVYANAAATPAVIMNAITVPPRSVALHPSPTLDVAVGWRNPSAGRVSIRAKVTDAHPSGGNGVEWSIVLRDAKSRRKVLAGGMVDRAGSQTIPPPADVAKLAAVTVVPGEVISLVVGPRGSYGCDSTSVELTITEVGGSGRTWNLARDVVANIQAGNPHADSFGNAKVWYFYAPPHPAVRK